jgi:hypothetical protein
MTCTSVGDDPDFGNQSIDQILNRISPKESL